MKILITLILFFGSIAQAQHEVAPDQYVDLMPLQLEYRFEDSTGQERTNRQYQSYGIGMQYSKYKAELEFSQFYDKTGNPSLKIEQTIREFNLGFGYRLYQLLSDDRRMSLNAFAKLWLGQTQTTIDTTLLTSQSSADSDKEMVLGAGGSLLVRISYFLAEADLKMLNSKNMSPQDVPVFAAKIGVTIPY